MPLPNRNNRLFRDMNAMLSSLMQRSTAENSLESEIRFIDAEIAAYVQEGNLHRATDAMNAVNSYLNSPSPILTYTYNVANLNASGNWTPFSDGATDFSPVTFNTRIEPQTLGGEMPTENALRCRWCQREIPLSDVDLSTSTGYAQRDYRGNPICQNCINDPGTVLCPNCEHYMRADSTYSELVDGLSVCRQCGSHSWQCEICLNRVSEELVRTQEGYACNSCATNFSTCESCRGRFRTNTLREIDGHMLCSRCRSTVDITRFEGITTELKTNKSGARTIGLEMECYTNGTEHRSVRLRRVWSAVGDGSLRSASTGIEYLSPIMAENNYESEIKVHCDQIPSAMVDHSCGLHIHLGTKGLSWWELLNFIKYCKMYEENFFSLVGRSRRENQYCIKLPPNVPKLNSKAAFISFLYGNPNLAEKQTDKYPSRMGGIIQRYWWVNIHSHFYRHTLEIRLYQGSTKAKEINNWIGLWLEVLKVAVKGPKFWKSPLEIIKEVKPELYTYWASPLSRNLAA